MTEGKSKSSGGAPNHVLYACCSLRGLIRCRLFKHRVLSRDAGDGSTFNDCWLLRVGTSINVQRFLDWMLIFEIGWSQGLRGVPVARLKREYLTGLLHKRLRLPLRSYIPSNQ